MPKFASRADAQLVDIVYQWITIAREGVEDIRGWRNHLRKRTWAENAGQWAKLDSDFHGLTLSLTHYLAGLHPTVDVSPLHDIYSWLAAWHGERSADSIPSQVKIDHVLERAVLVLHVIRGKFSVRIEPTGGNKRKRESEDNKQRDTGHRKLIGDRNADAKLLADWKAAKSNGQTRKSFAKHRSIAFSELSERLKRARSRQSYVPAE